MEPALRKEDIVAANPGKKLVPLEPGQIIMIPARRADAVPAGSAR